MNRGRSLLSTICSLEAINAASRHDARPKNSISGLNIPLQSSQSAAQNRKVDKNRVMQSSVRVFRRTADVTRSGKTVKASKSRDEVSTFYVIVRCRISRTFSGAL
jgi:hypothetical protein